MQEFNLQDASELIKLARRSIEYHLYTGKLYSYVTNNEKLLKKKGVFVTLNTYPEKQLRGCIGLPYAVKPLYLAVTEAAIGAAFDDPRFPQLSASELDKIIIEISLLTEPKLVKKEDIEDEIIIGKHGLIISRKNASGLLLPQVATEYGFDVKTFLDETCRKAGLPPLSWKYSDTRIFKFEAEIFREKRPNGSIERVVETQSK